MTALEKEDHERKDTLYAVAFMVTLLSFFAFSVVGLEVGPAIAKTLCFFDREIDHPACQ